jgi:hypothetical protein
MNLLLFLILITVGEAAYFEFTVEQQTSDGFHQQIAAWQDKADSLQGENKQLTDTKTGLLKNIAVVETQMTSLTDQLKNMQSSPAAPAPASPAAENTTPAPESGSDLGTITTVDGQTFQNCQLLKVESDGITFNHSQGITKILFPNLPLELQKRFGADPQSNAALEAAKVRYQEQMEQAGAATNVPAAPQ